MKKFMCEIRNLFFSRSKNMFLFGKLIIEHFGNDEFIKIKSFTRLVAAMKISAIGKTTF